MKLALVKRFVPFLLILLVSLVFIDCVFFFFCCHSYKAFFFFCNFYFNSFNLMLCVMIANVEGKCLVGEVPFELVCNSWMNAPDFASGETANLYKSVDLCPYFIQV